YGPITVDSLGQEGVSSARNQTLLRLLEDVAAAGERAAICENRGSGVGAIVASLRQAGLPIPIFDNRIASFRVTFLNGPRSVQGPTAAKRRKDRRAEIVSLLQSRNDWSRAEISQALGLTNSSIRNWLTILRDEGLIETTEQKTRSSKVRYRLSRAVLRGL